VVRENIKDCATDSVLRRNSRINDSAVTENLTREFGGYELSDNAADPAPVTFTCGTYWFGSRRKNTIRPGKSTCPTGAWTTTIVSITEDWAENLSARA
jgi:hypothetical protein